MLTNLPAILRQAELISSAQEQSVIEQINASGHAASEALLALELFDSQQLTQHLERLFSLPRVQLDTYQYPELCQQLGLRELITRFNALPIAKDNQQLTVAVADPSHLEVEDEFRFATSLRVELVLADYNELKGAIRRLYGRAVQSSNSHNRDINQDELTKLVDISSDEVGQIEDLSQDDYLSISV